MCEDTNLKAIHNCNLQKDMFTGLSSMCEDTNLKAIHNLIQVREKSTGLSSMCEDTNLKAIHNPRRMVSDTFFVVFNVRRY